MFWIIIIVPVVLLFWRLLFVRSITRANLGPAPTPAPIGSSGNQDSSTRTIPPRSQQPPIILQTTRVDEIEEEESHSTNSSPSVATTELIGKRSWYAWGEKNCAFMAGIGGLVAGYLTSVPGGLLAIPLFFRMVSRDIYLRKVHSHQDDFCVFRSQWLLLHTSVIHFMALAGIPLSVFCIRMWRRRVLHTAALLMLIGVACMSWFPHVSVEVMGMLVSGCGIGLVTKVIPNIYSETMSEKLKSIDMFGWGMSFGSVVATSSIYIASRYLVWGWRFSFGVAGVPILLLLALSVIMSESPYFLIERERVAEAKRVLQALRGSSDIEVEHALMVAQVRNQQSTNAFKEIISSPNRPKLVISTIEILFAKLSGMDLVIFFGPFLFESISYVKDKAFLAPVVLSLMLTTSKGVGALLVRRIGRRRMFLAAYTTTIISLVCLGIIFNLNEHPSYHLKPHRAMVSITLILIYTIGSGLLSGPYGWFEVEFCEGCAALGNDYLYCLGFLASFIGNQLFLHILCAVREQIFFFYATLCVLMMCFTWAFIPETTGITRQTMGQSVLRRHWFWRRYMT